MHMRAHHAGTLLDWHFIGVNDQLWAGWWLIRRINACKHFNLTQSRTSVEPLGVTLLTNLKGRVDENLSEWNVVFGTFLTDAIPFIFEGRNQRAYGDNARLRNQAGSRSSSPNVLRTVSLGKSQIRTEAMPEIVTIHDEAMPTPPV